MYIYEVVCPAAKTAITLMPGIALDSDAKSSSILHHQGPTSESSFGKLLG